MNKKILIIITLFMVVLTLNTFSANQKISASSNDYFTYYGLDTPAGQTHSFAIEVNRNVYYISDSAANKLASYSPSFRRLYSYDLEKYGNKFKPDVISFGSNGFNAYYQLDNTIDDEMFQIANDYPFDFEYKKGQHVGYNRDAKVITKIYYPNGQEITDTYY